MKEVEGADQSKAVPSLGNLAFSESLRAVALLKTIQQKNAHKVLSVACLENCNSYFIICYIFLNTNH